MAARGARLRLSEQEALRVVEEHSVEVERFTQVDAVQRLQLSQAPDQADATLVVERARDRESDCAGVAHSIRCFVEYVEQLLPRRARIERHAYRDAHAPRLEVDQRR